MPPEQKIQILDFRVEVPEGQTNVVITSRDGNDQELAHFQVERDGDVIKGIPEAIRHIAPREALSSEDAAFFRRELNGVLSPTDSPWTKANKIRMWLMQQPHRISMPGLATRIPREAYTQMMSGQPVLCGNLAEIYVALCQSIGLTARGLV